MDKFNEMYQVQITGTIFIFGGMMLFLLLNVFLMLLIDKLNRDPRYMRGAKRQRKLTGLPDDDELDFLPQKTIDKVVKDYATMGIKLKPYFVQSLKDCISIDELHDRIQKEITYKG